MYYRKLHLFKTPFLKPSLNAFNSLTKRDFSGVNHFKVSTVHTRESNKTTSKSEKEEYEIKAPLEALLACAGSCEVHSISFFAKKNKIPIEKIEIEIKADFDTDIFTKNKEGINTYSFIDVETKITSLEKDKDRLRETVEMGIKKCPVLNTLNLSGIKINKTIKYI